MDTYYGRMLKATNRLRSPWFLTMVSLAVCMMIAAIWLGVATDPAMMLALAQEAPVLVNPGLELPYRAVGAGEVTIATGWQPWWTEADGRHRPEWQPYEKGGVWPIVQGQTAQKQFTTFSTQDGGLFQVLDVQPGTWYKFTCMAYVRSSGHDSPADQSPDPTGALGVMVGLNPWGNTNALHRTTIWGRENDLGQRPWKVYNQWITLQVIAQAWGNRVAVFTRADALYPVKHNDVLWDNCSFVVYSVAEPCPTATACPDVTPVPTGDPAVCPSFEQIERLIADRPPVRWPR